MRYLKSHARRVYSDLRERRMMQVAQWLAPKGGSASDQDILQALVGGLRTADDTRRLHGTMAEHGHVTLTPDRAARKKSMVTVVTDQIGG